MNTQNTTPDTDAEFRAMRTTLGDADFEAQAACEHIRAMCSGARALLGPDPIKLIAADQLLSLIDTTADRLMDSINSMAGRHNVAFHDAAQFEREGELRRLCAEGSKS